MPVRPLVVRCRYDEENGFSPPNTMPQDFFTCVESILLESIKANPRNSRVHNANQIAKLAANINAFGFLVPVVVQSVSSLSAYNKHGRG
jgi:ParB-like nuclease domain